MLKLNEYFKLDNRIYDIYNRIRAELVSRGLDEVWNHTNRVIKNLYLVREISEFDFKTALIGAICHDIGYTEVIRGHDKAGAVIIKPVLDTYFNHKVVAEALHCIEAHECDSNIRPQTPEAVAVHDADMLDYCGEEGIINAFLLGRNLGLSKAATANRIVRSIDEGFLIKELRKQKAKEVRRTADFFTNFIKDMVKEKNDFANYGVTNNT